jgi:hypothetical protein
MGCLKGRGPKRRQFEKEVVQKEAFRGRFEKGSGSKGSNSGTAATHNGSFGCCTTGGGEASARKLRGGKTAASSPQRGEGGHHDNEALNHEVD